MGTPFLTGQTAGLVTKEARRSPHGIGGTSYASTTDPTHSKAYKQVEHGEADWAEVRVHDAPGRGPRPVLFRAWRVSDKSFAWQTSIMAAPAFMPYTAHDPEPETWEGTLFCRGCGSPLGRAQ